jgi:signal transduction histidine kinase
VKTRAPRTLGARLARDAGVCMATSLLLFAGVTLLALWLDLRDDTASGGESAFVELIEQVGWATLIAAPLATAFAVLSARWAARRATARLDELIARLARGLNALLARIEQGIAAQRRFAADVSHELRTPLAVIINALEVARARPRSQTQWVDVADQALDEARRLAGLVEALLHVARPRPERADAGVVELSEVFAPLAARWKERAPGLKLQLHAAPGLVLRADARALDIVFENLLSNALVHAHAQGSVRIDARVAGAGVRITVEDDGPGVPPAERQRVFAAFARGAHAADLDGTTPGVGLGLAIVRRIVEAGNGRIFIDDAGQAGARFVIEFGGVVGAG